jgi:alpha-beta hydrolase superfamily lysophospholipase
MKHTEGAFKAPNQDNIYYQAWLPESEAKVVMLVLHGLGEHSGRYQNLAQHFVALGYAVYALDHSGHGKSDGLREYIERFEDYSETVETFRAMIQDWQANQAIFLLGHSMGGLIAAQHLLKYQANFSGAIFSAPGIKLSDSITPLTIFLGKVLAALAPKMGLMALDYRGISRDPNIRKNYRDDPLVFHGKTTARLGVELLKTMQTVAAEAGKIRLPILILQGSADTMINPAGAQLLYDQASSKDKTLTFYQGFYHELFNEPEHALVFADVAAWLATRATCDGLPKT